MIAKDTAPVDEIGRVLERLADPLSRFISDALQFLVGDDHSGVVNRLLELDGSSSRVRIREISDLDLSGLLRLLDQCFFLPKQEQDRHGDGMWKRKFRSLFGVPVNAEWNHPDSKKIQSLISSVRTVRNEYAHRPAGVNVSVIQSISDLSKLHDLVTSHMRQIAHSKPEIFSNETRIVLDQLSEQIDAALAVLSRTRQSTRGIWPLIGIGIVVVLVLAYFLRGLLDTDRPTGSEVLLLGHQIPTDEVVEELASYLQSNLDSGSVAIRLITTEGLRPAVISLDQPADISVHALSDLFVGMKELPSARHSSDLVASAYGRMQAALSTGTSIMLVTLGSTGMFLDPDFEDDYRSERWHYTPNDFSVTWRSMRDKGRFYNPVFLYPRDINWLDSNNADSYQEEGLKPITIKVLTWN